ncbi:hypothetical protein DFH07DRAFT_1024008 [Mycena maculata]|uniref:Transmembrane protein n=1 Tax=Mycena maculata TaxID=230809 RepID=A0AAD7J9E7_9AGAR|nr:hypothetical protein DFH07DRAFT_1024008 [Mycena maculata]
MIQRQTRPALICWAASRKIADAARGRKRCPLHPASNPTARSSHGPYGPPRLVYYYFPQFFRSSLARPTCSAPPFGAVKTAVPGLSALFLTSASGASLSMSFSAGPHRLRCFHGLSRSWLSFPRSSVFAALFKNVRHLLAPPPTPPPVCHHLSSDPTFVSEPPRGIVVQSFASLGLVHVLSIPTAVAILFEIMTVGFITLLPAFRQVTLGRTSSVKFLKGCQFEAAAMGRRGRGGKAESIRMVYGIDGGELSEI